jgi:hypothetical protein
MTRLRKANRNKGWEKRNTAKIIFGLRQVIESQELTMLGLRSALANAAYQVEEKANRRAAEILNVKHLNEILNRMAIELSREDARYLYDWMKNNEKLCVAQGIYNAQTAEKFLNFRAQRRRTDLAPRPGFRVAHERDRKMTRITINLPAIAYSILVDELMKA